MSCRKSCWPRQLISDADPARHDYYGLVGRLDEAIDGAISNTYLEQAMRGLRVHLVRVRRLAADDATRLTAAAAEHAAIAEAIAVRNPRLAEAATTLHLHHSLTPSQGHPHASIRSTMVKNNNVRVYKSEENLPPARNNWPTRSLWSPPTPPLT